MSGLRPFWEFVNLGNVRTSNPVRARVAHSALASLMRGSIRKGRKPLLSPEDIARIRTMYPSSCIPKKAAQAIARRKHRDKSVMRELGLLKHLGDFPEGLFKRMYWSREQEVQELISALGNPFLWKGWPDCGSVEMKIGPDWVRANQWVRFAWLKKYMDIDVRILKAATQKDAVCSNTSELYLSIKDYIFARYERTDANKVNDWWEKLIEIVPEKEINEYRNNS